jgi:leader peptidase (prepilin peptidase) / N-methyltransferase
VSVEWPALLVATKAAFGCLAFAVVVTMAVVDYREMILPDRLNLSLAAGAISQAVFVGHPDIGDSLMGALFGFVVLGAVAAPFRRLRGISGLGFGEHKFSAAAGSGLDGSRMRRCC